MATQPQGAIVATLGCEKAAEQPGPGSLSGGSRHLGRTQGQASILVMLQFPL